ncbi:MAG: polysaccharide biosynthesis protein GumN [Caulobacterales bacterium RIFOXYB1_FULL_67_16]|jgi:hypothetical protein|nr:MAG: polysaccharide biosynthesis protein GumN [Caulobacterales bacterium RIFOXYB1_FULL_67_16]
MIRPLHLVLALTIAGAALPAAAQDGEATPEAVEDIVVVARRIEGPMWHVRSGDSTLILVGSIDGLPRDLEWRTDALVSAVERADRVLFPVQARASLADVGRVIWRARTLTRLPEGRTTADYLSPALEDRLERVTGEGPSRDSLLVLSADLMEKGGYSSRNRPVSDVVRRAARKNRKPAEPVGMYRADEIIDRILTTPPERYLDCMEAAVTAAEIGPEEGARRAEAWRLRRVQDVLASPLEQAVTTCSYWAVMGQGDALEATWSTAIDQALAEEGVTVAIAPLRLLAQPGGLLDRLEAKGLEPLGPDWRPAP